MSLTNHFQRHRCAPQLRSLHSTGLTRRVTCRRPREAWPFFFSCDRVCNHQSTCFLSNMDVLGRLASCRRAPCCSRERSRRARENLSHVSVSTCAWLSTTSMYRRNFVPVPYARAVKNPTQCDPKLESELGYNMTESRAPVPDGPSPVTPCRGCRHRGC